jgi:hypothetical protein
MRREARADAVGAALGYSRVIGLAPPSRAPGDLIVMTGHQPELYHPGIWVKNFVLQRLSEELPALGIDLVVDTDAADGIELVAPLLGPEVGVRRVSLCDPTPDAAYMQRPVPDADARAVFRSAGLAALATLPAPALERHFESFAESLDEAAPHVPDLGSLMTAARRRYERPARTDYLELPVSVQAQTRSLRRFAALLITDAERFADIVNTSLAAYRTRTGTRSAAQPFPDLGVGDDLVEVPFWLLRDGTRMPMYVDRRGRLLAADTVVAAVGGDAERVQTALEREDLLIAPKALALTMFERMFVADLFIHGTGGGRYDRVTDAVIRRHYGVEPPGYVVASMTLLLPLGCRITSDAEVSALEQRLHRIEHNPDQVLGEVEFDTVTERTRAEELARKKASLVAEIGQPGADRKTLGLAIRDVNAELTGVLAPLLAETRATLARVRSERDASAILTDRTYPYCLWDPREVADKVR